MLNSPQPKRKKNQYLLWVSLKSGSICLENPMDRGAWWARVHCLRRVRHNWSNFTQSDIYMYIMIYMYIYIIHIQIIYVYIYQRYLQIVKCNTLLAILPDLRTPQGWMRLMKTEYTLYSSHPRVWPPLFSTLGLCGQDMPRWAALTQRWPRGEHRVGAPRGENIHYGFL